MKNGHHNTTSDTIDNRLEMSNHKVAVPKSKLVAGSLDEKYPILLDDGRTIVFISDKSREREVRLRYALRKG